MENIEIIFIETENDEYWKGWLVKQADRYADGLGYDEMLGLIASLTMPPERPTLQWMKTKEQREKERAFNQVNDESTQYQ